MEVGWYVHEAELHPVDPDQLTLARWVSGISMIVPADVRAAGRAIVAANSMAMILVHELCLYRSVPSVIGGYGLGPSLGHCEGHMTYSELLGPVPALLDGIGQSTI